MSVGAPLTTHIEGNMAMHIETVNIYNYKCYYGKFSIDFNKGVNILVGDNGSGKSTIIEATHLALSGLLQGRYLKNELSQYLFNCKVICEYLDRVNDGGDATLPEICIEVFFNKGSVPKFQGSGNKDGRDSCGVSFKVEFDDTYTKEYSELIKSGGKLNTLPIEYYKVSWTSFDRDSVTSRGIPIKSVLIDSASNKYQNGSDVYISRIIRNELDEKEKVKLSQAYRKMKDSFTEEEAVKEINSKIDKKSKVQGEHLSISVDLSTQNSWESSLMTYLGDIPFHQVGKGSQCMIKTNLALSHKKTKEASLLLIEEPENHLSHSKLNYLLKEITDGSIDKQVIISTHSSFVANKLGLENLLLLNDHKITRFTELSKETFDFFKKLPGYQTLRLVLCKKAILVEGDSDELVFQRAYMDANDGVLPIEHGFDVISVKLTFKRFLEIADKINKNVAVITDNDGKYADTITKKYKDYLKHPHISIFADDRNDLNTLEPQFADANKGVLPALCKELGLAVEEFNTVEKLSTKLQTQKTSWALKVFESKVKFSYPKYITDAVVWCNE
ncbi:ATP-dependent nuclease [Vibrio vulnificus]|uniref:ATP-dependent nuclease n=1 Tax=Vibrio vulnificus TaxID=672 RepID=UPI001A9129AB|nr:AAA family ATPase [Vibrio vulnificus]EHZ7122633.1 AAA family ATPase [Vibrio vulnificus]EIJ0945521.1 AAA family ATPase [Vibrio vulnificus]EJD0673579.1 AAA family ATPase [Vibrio vulnificus]EJZ7969340.1 AAA family ATPase [Vibrio vulnificus]MCU8167566.1 AAA family ATPase [Vibrio vulnificus]